ncbi:MAG: hypothetical protein Q4C70_11205, partial [Planctomycetia bacterium]|nr:hypothetical protein [Planctomycetia bacterium]
EGRAEGVKDMFMQMFHVKFNEEVSSNIRRKVDSISDMEELQQLNMALMMASDKEQFIRNFLK